MKTIKDGIIGLAIGDAIGVPVEFQSREELKQNPVVDLRGFGVHYQPPGTWSDDSSLTFCTAEALLKEFNLLEIARNFILWKYRMFWTPHGEVFDIGIQTSRAIERLREIVNSQEYDNLKYLKYDADEYTNGNGSLMRILPLYYCIQGNIEDNFDIIWEVSALTHGHIRSSIACLIYLIMVDELMSGKTKQESYQNTRNRIVGFFQEKDIVDREKQLFDRIVEGDIQLLKVEDIKSTGYVIHTLEASFWCFLNTETFEDCILKAVNLGEDTDTIGAIAGGLAGIYYGAHSFPENWTNNLVMLNQIEDLCNRLEARWK